MMQLKTNTGDRNALLLCFCDIALVQYSGPVTGFRMAGIQNRRHPTVLLWEAPFLIKTSLFQSQTPHHGNWVYSHLGGKGKEIATSFVTNCATCSRTACEMRWQLAHLPADANVSPPFMGRKIIICSLFQWLLSADLNECSFWKLQNFISLDLSVQEKGLFFSCCLWDPPYSMKTVMTAALVDQ